MRKGSVKNNRINSEVQKELSSLIQNELKDPRVSPMTSVVNCVVSPDLKQCKAFVSVLGTEDEAKKTMEGLKAASPFLRRRLAETVNLRNTPEIRFVLDNGIEYGMRLSELIEKVKAEDEEAMRNRGEESVSEDEEEI